MDVAVELQHRHRIMVHALRVILDDAENAGAVKTRERLERLHDELRSNRPMAEWSLQRLMGDTPLVEGEACPTCKTSVIVLCECGQGDPAEHLICLGCGEDPPECDCD